MTANPYIPHLITDPTFGYLFPHRLALAAFGVPSDYHLRKHYPRLVEGQHYLKIRGTDHVERIFYTLVGLLALVDLVNTPQAHAFKQALITHTQPGGALVTLPPAPPPTAPFAEPPPLAVYPTPPTGLAIPGSALKAAPADLLTPYLQPQSEPTLARSPALRPPMPYQTPQDTAALIFEAQRLAHEQAQRTAQTLLAAHQNSPPDIQVHVNLWKRWDDWFAQQDTWAVALIAAGVMALAGTSAYLVVAASVRPLPPAPTSTQTWR